MSSTKFFGEMDTASISSDNVNHPKHYTNGDIECIDAIKASLLSDAHARYVGYAGYLKGNVLKYLWRYQLKKNPVEDLEKAKWYLEKLIDVTKKEGLDD